MKRKITVKFVDFWKSFEPEKSIFLQVLREKYEIVLSDEADYIFYSSFGDDILNEPDGKAIKIYYIGENQSPDFNLCDYAMAFEHMTLGDRYFRLPDYYNSDFYRRETEMMEKKHLGIESIASLGKTGFCSFVVSNAKGAKERQEMMEILNKYKTVSSGGKFMNNVGGPVPDKIAFEKKHKFSICFDNCKYRGYTTEKIVEAFAAQTIPIYWGDPEVSKVFNPKAFINVMDFPSLQDAADYIQKVDIDDELYLSMLKEPALLFDEDTYGNTRKRLAEWLYHIIDQPKEGARRTGDGFWHTDYYWHQRNYKYAFEHPFKLALKRFLKKFGV